MIFCSFIKISLQIFTPLNSIFQEITYQVVVVGFRIVVVVVVVVDDNTAQYLLTYIATKVLVFFDA